MDELRTLESMPYSTYCFKADLKDEAILWVKEFQSNPEAKKLFDAMTWVMYFFGIGWEDLK